MPGLAPTATSDTSQTIVTSATDERLLGTDQQHRLLIRPDAFHVTVLFQPTLSFLQRVSEILPSGIESPQTSSVVLDQFVLNVYLPRLEEKVSDLFHEAVTGIYLSIQFSLSGIDPHTLTGPEMFQPDPLSWRLSSEPLAKVCDVCHIKHYLSFLTRIEGKHTSYGSHQLSMCHASQQSIPPRKLFEADIGSRDTILSKMQ